MSARRYDCNCLSAVAQRSHPARLGRPCACKLGTRSPSARSRCPRTSSRSKWTSRTRSRRSATRCGALCLPSLVHGNALTAPRLYRAYAILVEPPKTTFGKVRLRPAASLYAPCSTPLPATGAQDLLGQGRRRTRRCVHRLAARCDGTSLLLYLGKVTLLRPQTSHTHTHTHTHIHPAPNRQLPQQVRALPTHEQAHDGLKRLTVLTPAELCVNAFAILWLLRGDRLARGQSLYPSPVPRCNLRRQVIIPILSVAPHVLL